jgi:mRNA interferase RelE/StbE
MRYRVLVSRTARKHLDGLPERMRARIGREIAALADEPRPLGHVKLKGFADEYRIRIGDYRVRYRINDKTTEVELIDIRHRKDIYRP